MSDTLTGMVSSTGRAREAHALSIVIPAKNEEESLPLVVARIMAAGAASGQVLRDIVLVDDGSSDETWRVMAELAADNELIQAIRLRRNFGKATALMVAPALMTTLVAGWGQPGWLVLAAIFLVPAVTVMPVARWALNRGTRSASGQAASASARPT